MATAEERMRILKMIEQKQISPADGARLLEALRASQTEEQPQPNRARWLRVRVTDRGSGRTKLNVNLPISLLDVGLKMGARFAPDMAGMDLNAIQVAIKQGMQGKIVEVENEDEGEQIEVFVE